MKKFKFKTEMGYLKVLHSKKKQKDAIYIPVGPGIEHECTVYESRDELLKQLQLGKFSKVLTLRFGAVLKYEDYSSKKDDNDLELNAYFIDFYKDHEDKLHILSW